MVIYHLSQPELVSLFQSRAAIARDAASRSHTLRESQCLQTEAATWDAAAKILSQTLLTPEIPITRIPPINPKGPQS